MRVLYELCFNGFAYTRKMNENVWASMSNPILHYEQKSYNIHKKSFPLF